jgi:PAS domain S-box-containing protein/putative nucleotidyltransferase with HDIG domain
MRFVEINGSGCRMVGYTREELFEMGPSQLASVSAKVLSLTYDALIAGQVSKELAELTFQRKDGSSFQAEIRRHVHRFGADWIVVDVIRDITEKKRSERDILNYVVQLKTAFMSTVNVATILSEMRDPYAAGHERRVGEIASAIGAEIGFDSRRQEGLVVAGYLHDIGKIGVPSEILSKPGSLSVTQRELIQEHAQGGFDVLKDVEFPWPVAQIAHQHHERMDGSGYPQGLRGDAILLEARIMAVADVVEAMSSHRPYRAALGIEKALAEIERGRATVYDALVADACVKLFREKGYAIPA